MKRTIKYICLCLVLIFCMVEAVEGKSKTTINCSLTNIMVGKDSDLGLESSISSSFNVQSERSISSNANKSINLILGSGASPRISEHAREAVANTSLGGLIKYRLNYNLIGGFRLVYDAGILNTFKKPIMYRLIGAIDAYASIFGKNISYVTVLGCVPLKSPQLQYDIDVDFNLLSRDVKNQILTDGGATLTNSNIIKKAYWIYPQAAVELHVGQQIFDRVWCSLTLGAGISTHQTITNASAVEYFGHLRMRYYFSSVPICLDLGLQASDNMVLSLFVSLNVFKMYHDNIGSPLTIDDMMYMSLVQSTITKRTGYIVSDQYIADVDKILSWSRNGGYSKVGMPVQSSIESLIKFFEEMEERNDSM